MGNKSPFLSIVIGYRDRETERLKRFLESLTWQTFKDFELIVVDYGSTTKFAEEVKAICFHYSFCTYLYSNTRGMVWSRTSALNIGIKYAKGEFTTTTDADMIFSENALQLISEQCSEKKQIYSSVYFTDREFTDWQKLRNTKIDSFQLQAQKPAGGCHTVKTSILHEIGGFDEFYRFWGEEDADIYARLTKKGLTAEWTNPKECWIYHQWHAKENAQTSFFMPQHWWAQMAIYSGLQTNTIERNGNAWGSILESNNRPVLRYAEDAKPCEKQLSFSGIGNIYEKSLSLKHLTREFSNLETGKTIAIEIENVKFTTAKQSKGIKFLVNMFRKLLQRTKSGYTVVTKNAELLAKKDNTFIPQIDIYFAVWQLIIQGLTADYYFRATESTRIVYLTK
jgi:glycosyltransferase involved in cell wall biosynthesis